MSKAKCEGLGEFLYNFKVEKADLYKIQKLVCVNILISLKLTIAIHEKIPLKAW